MDFLISSLAYNLYHVFQQTILEEKDQTIRMNTYRLKYQKIAVKVIQHARQVTLSFSSAYKIKLSLLSTGIKCCRFNVLNLYFKTQQCLISFYILISNHSKTKWKRLAELDPSTRLIFFYYLFMNNSGYILTQNTLKLVVSVFIKLKGANDTKKYLSCFYAFYDYEYS